MDKNLGYFPVGESLNILNTNGLTLPSPIFLHFLREFE